MRILIDIGHPAHVHYFRNFIRVMQEKGHDILITARDKEVSHVLLKKYNLKFISRGKGSNSIIGKLLYILKADFIIWKIAKKFKPDIFLSFASLYSAHVSWLCNRPCVILDDTEHAKFNHFFYKTFTNTILTPSVFTKDMGRKQIRFNSFIELCSLHNNYFKPDKTVLKDLCVGDEEKYVILRFISWSASHDIGHSGLTLEMKHKLVKELSKYAKVFISAEAELPEEFKQYQLKIPPDKLHDVLAFASLYIGEGGTTANECACLGVPNILVNSLLNPGTIPGIHIELEKYGLQILFEEADDKIIEITSRILNDNETIIEFTENKNKMLADKIDITAFMVWFIENYPESAKIMKENPEYQMRFK